MGFQDSTALVGSSIIFILSPTTFGVPAQLSTHLPSPHLTPQKNEVRNWPTS
ncbi:UNVERIFIED_CONTAM: hypothetical protein GTU68_051457 [Idotea baltica]|nr:hypothetical protein [Idotea baltica]